MKKILIILLIIIQLFAKDITIIEKQIDMGNGNFAYMDYDKEWDIEGILQFSRNFKCHYASSGNTSCESSDYYDNEIYSLKGIIFDDITIMNNEKKGLESQRFKDYCSLYNNYDFKNTSYEALFSYLFLVNDRYSQVKQKCFTPKFTKILSLKFLSIEKPKDLEKYNNMAYYLQQANANNEAIFLLEKIIEKFPNRTVAYLNLGDAYNGINNKEKAKSNYEKYIELMKKLGKEAKIPKRVLEFK